ncbi:putative phage abortive infection protein [Phaeobacter gallaeciensis]|uniref:putative phage abortive infection protein n=1 Tax=Phaeobacter gallaeciensis TaxID=60890 RepID=UPI00238044D0|nr:putative phage abortive infection protein [Phaeobacter gallaeciensis]MDE4275597.1 putative phage abortive infection protein [Phaeobacter gallaeciensis]MDE4300652.1 putative phage abortive infection protein [Phaeobacter gallaeciensis]MDE5185816.1 putative phage abortive infection protein [Phaeobacter gallaeciensis]
MQEDSATSVGWGTGLAFAAVIGGWFISPNLLRWWHGDFQSAGPFGDSYGALTSLFTGLAFVGLIVTLRQQKRQIEMQREDLKLQRQEMQASREELAGQKAQMELQNQSLRQQMFEKTFFNLLSVFNQYINDIVGPSRDGKTPRSGRDQLADILYLLAATHGWVMVMGGPEPTDEEKASSSARQFLEGYGEHADDLNSYFRLLYNVLKLVDQSAATEKKVYTNILRAQLSDSELQLIALNCARSQGKKLKALVDEYQILKHLPEHLNGVSTEVVCEEIAKLETGA